jgi:hypothetical protein
MAYANENAQHTLEEVDPLIGTGPSASRLSAFTSVIVPTGGDDTTLINQAIQNAAGGKSKRVILSGEFKVSAPSSYQPVINMLSNVLLEFLPGSKLLLQPNNFDGYQILSCQNISNFKILNPYIVGDRDTHSGTTGEFGHGLVLWGCKDFEVRNAYAEKCWGDGVSIDNYGTNPTESGYIDRIRTYKCRRNGTTIASARNIQIDYLEGKQIDGTSPKAALDIESNAANEVWDNIKIGKVRSIQCPGGVMFQPFGMKQNAYVTTIDISIDSVEIKGTDTSDTGNLWIDGVDYTKVNGRIKIKDILVDKADRGLYIVNVLNGGISVHLDNVKLITSKAGDVYGLGNRSALYFGMDASLQSSKNIGKIFIDRLEVTGDAEYFLYYLGQTSGTLEAPNVRINHILDRVPLPMRIDGYLNKLSENILTEVDVMSLAATYNPGAGWFSYHFLSTLYHNATAPGDYILSPAGPDLKLKDTPIVLENRTGLGYLGIDLTGKTILPTSLGFVNGFKSNEKGARIRFRQIDGNTFYVMERVGNWVTK